jgi:cell division protein FtsB
MIDLRLHRMTMKLVRVMFALLTLAWAASASFAQNPHNTLEGLRAQLRDVEAKETELAARVKRLDEDLKPENIERAFQLTGSTRPEELREQRRRQLEREKESVRLQQDQLTLSRTRLQTAIAAAEAAAYRQSANPTDASLGTQTSVDDGQSIKTTQEQPRRNRTRNRRARRPRIKRRG